MFQVDNFISFHDLSPDGGFLWASSSITTCLGYEPEEIVGVKAYNIIHKDDHNYVKINHQENVLNELVGTQIVLRFKHKNGTWIPCMVIFSLCYDYIVTCTTVIDQTDNGAIHKISAHSAAMTKIVGSKKEEFERIRRHHGAFGPGTWNPNGLDPEPRACMILNRFSRNLNIMYASPSCKLVFGVAPSLIVDKPFLLYIRADDLASFVEQVDIAKSSNVVTHMRFWFQSPMCHVEIPCEAMLFGAADGLVAILRRCKPFVRKRLITIGLQENKAGISLSTNYGNERRSSSEYFASSSSACSSFTSGVGATDTSPNYTNIHNNGGMSSSSNQAYMSSPSISSCGSSYTSSSSASSYLQYPYVPSSYSYRAPLRGLPIGSINSIRNLDREHRNVRPLTSLHVDGTVIEEETSCLPESYRLRTHHIKEDDVDDDDDADTGANVDEYVDLDENQYRGHIQDSGLETDMDVLYLNEAEQHSRGHVLVEDADAIQEVLEEWIPIRNGKGGTQANRNENRSTSRSRVTNQRGSSQY